MSMGTKIRIDSVMCPRSSSRGHITSASVTVTVYSIWKLSNSQLSVTKNSGRENCLLLTLHLGALLDSLPDYLHDPFVSRATFRQHLKMLLYASY